MDIKTASTNALNRAFDEANRIIAKYNADIDKHGRSSLELAIAAHQASSVSRAIAKELDARGKLMTIDEIFAELEA